MRELISTAVTRDLKDPRIGFVTVTGVEATSDFAHAKVFVSVLGTPEEKEATLAGLRSASGVLQGLINDEMHLRRTPELDFVYDGSVDTGMRIQELLKNTPLPPEADEAEGSLDDDA
jgi:ribosome-binding factor A